MAAVRTIGAAALAVAVLVCGGCSQESDAREQPSLTRLDVEASSAFKGALLADFELVDQLGAAARRADFAGAPAVLDFIFTTCTGPCPRVSANMARVQQQTAGTSVRLASFSVDPETDTPEVLAAYAQGYGADATRWRFLTGAEEQIDGVLRSLWLARSKNDEVALGLRVTHSTRLVVLDGRGVLRGMYDGESEAGVEAALARSRWLAEHPDA
ncbi:MAG: SCO family protein [Planctomycetes bacterium]|nr:SCO family protein [Planctomycetota bacterium]